MWTYWKTTGGEDLKNPENGLFDHGFIDGYQWIKTNVLEDGSLLHIFKKIEKPTPYIPTPDQPIPDKPTPDTPSDCKPKTKCTTIPKLPKTGSQTSNMVLSSQVASILTGIGLVLINSKKKEK